MCAIVFSRSVLVTAVEWRCGLSGGYSVVWCGLCLQTNMQCGTYVWVFFSEKRTSSDCLIKHQKAFLCVFFYGKKCRRDVLIHPWSSDKTWLSAYLAVEIDDLCTVFALQFMCCSDKAGRPVFMSACFMSVYWDHRLSDCLLEDTNNIPWECSVPPVPSPIPYLQHSHMSNVYYLQKAGTFDFLAAYDHMQMECI